MDMIPTAPLEPGYSPGPDWSNTIRLFVQNMNSRTIVLMARPHDTLGELLGRFAGVGRRSDLHAVYEDRQLPPGATIGELRLPPDATLHLTPYPDAWSLASQIAAAATARTPVSAEAAEFYRNLMGDANGRFPDCMLRLARYLHVPDSAPRDAVFALASAMLVSRDTVLLVREFLRGASTVHQRQPPHRAEMMGEYLNVLLRGGVIGLLVRIYLSSDKQYHYRGQSAIMAFMQILDRIPFHALRACSAPVLLELCRMIASGSTHGKNDLLYRRCRGNLANVISLHDMPSGLPREWWVPRLIPFAQETANELVLYMAKGAWVPSPVVFQFRAFFSVLCRNVRAPCATADSSPDGRAGAALSETATSLLTAVSRFMASLDSSSDEDSTPPSDEDLQDAAVDRIWVVLGALDLWSETHGQFAAAMRATLTTHAAYLNALVLGTSASRSRQQDVARIIAKHRDLLGAEARRNFSTALLPEDADNDLLMEPPLEVFIDRSRLLSDSLRYISEAERGELHAGLEVGFVNEEALGDGVTREWISLVCRAIFDPQRGLFSPCPRDRRRFFLNSAAASGADPLHDLKHFEFAGRMIGLALTHNVQVGILFDRTLFSLLAGRPIALDDIVDADPTMHASCKKILEMDPELVDSGALGLTFAREVRVLGSLETIELLPGGRDVHVDSKNRCQYIHLLIQDIFANSTRDQLNSFTEGFSYMLVRAESRGAFFRTLDLEDLDQMLGGRTGAMDVQEWKEYTTYSEGYNEQDDQISWFWQAVASLTAEEQRRLLFFWTAVEYLPFNGFQGLSLEGNMRISKASSDTPDHLPSSSTCMYRLNLPCYTSFAMTLNRLRVIAQEHMSYSFGDI